MTAFDPERHCGGRRRSDDLKGAGRKGEPCRLPKGWGTDHPGTGNCRRHLGSTPNGERHARREQAAAALERLSVAVEIDPQEALIQLVYESAGVVAFLRAELQKLPVRSKVRNEVIGGEEEGTKVRVVQVLEQEGLIGPDHLGDQQPNVLWDLYNEERDRLAKTAKMAIDAGIAEQRIALFTRLANHIVTVVNASLNAIPLTPAQRELGVRAAMTELRVLDAEVQLLGAGSN